MRMRVVSTVAPCGSFARLCWIRRVGPSPKMHSWIQCAVQTARRSIPESRRTSNAYRKPGSSAPSKWAQEGALPLPGSALEELFSSIPDRLSANRKLFRLLPVCPLPLNWQDRSYKPSPYPPEMRHCIDIKILAGRRQRERFFDLVGRKYAI